jgi:HSP20 family protein
MSSASQANIGTMRDRNPFSEIERFFERMSEQFEDTAEWPGQLRQDTAADLVDAGEEFEVRVDVPGFEKDDIELTLSEATLRVRAERDTEDDDVRYLRRERHDGDIDRTVSLPDNIDDEHVDATLSDGVLTVAIGKVATGEDAKSIDIE